MLPAAKLPKEPRQVHLPLDVNFCPWRFCERHSAYVNTTLFAIFLIHPTRYLNKRYGCEMSKDFITFLNINLFDFYSKWNLNFQILREKMG